MFMRSIQLFRFPNGALPAWDCNDTPFADHRLKPVGPLELSSRGWVSPFGRGEDEMTHAIGPYTLLTLGSEERILPAAVVNEFLADEIAKLTEERGKPPGGRERKRMRDDALHTLLPRAFVRPGRLSGYIDAVNQWVVVDTTSRKQAETFVTALRETFGSFPCIPPDPEESPSVLMTGWLSGDKLPEGFELGDRVVLKDPADKGSKVTGVRLDLESTEVREHLKSGKMAASVGLIVDGQVSFVLDETLTIRSLKFLDVVTENLENSDRDSPRAELDARFALMTLTLAPVLERLAETFRLKRPRAR